MPSSTARARRSVATARAMACLVISAFLLLVGSAVAQAADYPLPTYAQGSVNGTVFTPGEPVTFSGNGYLPRGKGHPHGPGTEGMKPGVVQITDNGAPLGAASVDSAGNFSFTFTFSNDAPLGRHVLEAKGIGANGAARTTTAVVYLVGVQTSGVSDSLAVTGDGEGGGHALPFTGSDLAQMLAVGLVLSLAGTLMVRRNLNSRAARRAARRARRSLAV